MAFPILTAPFIITTIMLTVAYVVYVVLTTIDNDYKNVDSRCKFEFMILKYAGYGALYLGFAIAMFFMYSVTKDGGKDKDMKMIDYLSYLVALLVTAYTVITIYIHIHSLRKFKAMKTSSTSPDPAKTGKKFVEDTITSLATIFTSKKAFCDNKENKSIYSTFCA